MSLSKTVAIPSSLPDLIAARNDALRLFNDARHLIAKAEETLAVHGANLMPYDAQLRGDEILVQRELDSRMWRRAFDLTGFKQLMDAQAVGEFEKSVESKPPAFTMDNIRATFIDLHLQADELFRRGVFNVFRYLSDDYRTNAAEPFRIGRKVVMGWMVEAGFRRGLRIRYDSGAKLNDLDRVFTTLDKKVFQQRSLEMVMNEAFEQGQVFESDYYRARAFKNGNLHLEFKRLDLLELVNEQIADYYGSNVLPDARCA